VSIIVKLRRAHVRAAGTKALHLIGVPFTAAVDRAVALTAAVERRNRD